MSYTAVYIYRDVLELGVCVQPRNQSRFQFVHYQNEDDYYLPGLAFLDLEAYQHLLKDDDVLSLAYLPQQVQC